VPISPRRGFGSGWSARCEARTYDLDLHERGPESATRKASTGPRALSRHPMRPSETWQTPCTESAFALAGPSEQNRLDLSNDLLVRQHGVSPRESEFSVVCISFVTTPSMKECRPCVDEERPLWPQAQETEHGERAPTSRRQGIVEGQLRCRQPGRSAARAKESDAANRRAGGRAATERASRRLDRITLSGWEGVPSRSRIAARCWTATRNDSPSANSPAAYPAARASWN
jgi:hypothetical protein